MSSDQVASTPVTRDELERLLPRGVLAFRGYNVTNLGRTPELLADPRYGGILREELTRCGEAAGDLLLRRVDLVELVEQRLDPSLDRYAEAVALILAVESAQLRLLAEVHGIDWRRAKLSLGFSLGEVAALAAGGAIGLEHAMWAPLPLAEDCVALAEGTRLAVLFSRGAPVPLDQVRRWCQEVNESGHGVIGVSAVLSPNSLLVMGQEDTTDRLRERLRAESKALQVRGNPHRWPPLHTPIVWQRRIPCRAGELLHTMPVTYRTPSPPVVSLVTGRPSYTGDNVRELLHTWIDHPQLLWDAVYHTLAAGAESVIHIGPAPNIIPATYQRLGDNVAAQLKANLGMRTLAQIAHRPWLKALLPERTALLRAPTVRQVLLEDWLLSQPP